MRQLQTKQPHKKNIQVQKATARTGNVTQVGGDFTQTMHTNIKLWISFVFVFAIAASVFLRLFGDYLPGMQVHIEESVPAEQINESEERL